MRFVEGERSPDHQSARGLVEGADFEQHAPDIGMHQDGIGRLAGLLGAGQRAALQALFGVGGRVLVGGFGLRETLHGDVEAGAVHHHEHRIEPAIFLADKPTLRTVIIHHAGRIAVDAHLVFDRAARHFVSLGQRSVVVDQHLRDEEERNALDAGRGALDAREHEVNDVFGEIMLARGDEDFLARDRE